MKRTLRLMLIASLATLSLSAQASEKNGALERAEMDDSEVFFTGKPFDEDLDVYLFAYRNYSPEVSRWTSADPSGFPDGANNHFYAPNPLTEIDPLGLLRWNTLQLTQAQWNPILLGHQATFDVYTITANDGTTQLSLMKYVGGIPPAVLAANHADFSYNCLGYLFANSQYWINPGAAFATPSIAAIVKAEGYKEMTAGPYANAKIMSWGDAHIAWTSDNDGTNVTEVTGKRGGEDTLNTSAPATHWPNGTPTYWE